MNSIRSSPTCSRHRKRIAQGIRRPVRFSRKTREQYVTTEKGGKPTGWSAHYSGGRWAERDAPKRAKPKAKAKARPKAKAKSKARPRSRSAAKNP